MPVRVSLKHWADLELSTLGFHYILDPRVNDLPPLVEEDCPCSEEGGPPTGEAFHTILVPSIPRAYGHGLGDAGHLWLFHDNALQS